MRVAVVMGSKSDLVKVEPAITLLKSFGVKVDVRILSAHRTPRELEDFINETKENGTEAIIAAAGMAAALPGVIASQTIIPVIGLPISGSVLDGVDALYSIVQMPSGIPVATVGVNGGENAGLLALQILGIKYPEIAAQLGDYKKAMQDKINADDAALQELL